MKLPAGLRLWLIPSTAAVAAIKNVNVNLGTQVQPLYTDYSSQRLIDPSTLQSVPAVAVTAADDIMDPDNNPTAQHFEQLINATGQAQRQRVMDCVTNPPDNNQSSTDPPDYWFMNNAPSPSELPKGYSAFDNLLT